jgi:hypothetical protein
MNATNRLFGYQYRPVIDRVNGVAHPSRSSLRVGEGWVGDDVGA